MGRVIGIDLGTTNSVAAFLDANGVPHIVVNGDGGRLMPSVVSFSPAGDQLVGAVAQRQVAAHPERTVCQVKRLMGRRRAEIQGAERLPYPLVEHGGELMLVVNNTMVSPQEVSAHILRTIKHAAQNYLGEAVTEAVITVPAWFDDRQRQATRDAGRIAGLEVIKILNEPTAAALAYLSARRRTGRIAVFDFGGGTFDVSILEAGDDVARVLGTAGNPQLGGVDIDRRLVDWIADEYGRVHHRPLELDPVTRQRLEEAAERAKVELSNAEETELHLPFLSADEQGPRHLKAVLTRQRFEALVDDLLRATIVECKKALIAAGCEPASVDEVVLVGGSSKIPRVQFLVRQFFGRPLNKSFNPDESVAIGAALQAGLLKGRSRVTLLDVTSFSLGIEVEGRRMASLIPRNSTVPVNRAQLVSTVTDDQRVVRIHVLQGESEWADDNVSLGEFTLKGIPPGPRGTPRIEVTFALDASGMVSVKARDLATGSSQGLEIANPAAMTARAIETSRARLEGGELAAERQQVETLLFELETFMREYRPRFRKKDMDDADLALRRGRMAVHNARTAHGLAEARGYLQSFSSALRERVVGRARRVRVGK